MANCFTCRGQDCGGLGLTFDIVDDEVCGEWTGSKNFESYVGIIHGGILATLLDSTMVHALFAYGIAARTGRFELRYRRSVRSAVPLVIQTHICEKHHPLYLMEASILQDNAVCVEATGKFMATAVYAEKDLF